MLAAKQSVMSVMASGGTVCINTLYALVYRKSPIWFQRNTVRHTGDPFGYSFFFFLMENITGLERLHCSPISSDRQDNNLKESRLHIPESSPFPTCKHRARLLKNYPEKPSGLYVIPLLWDIKDNTVVMLRKLQSTNAEFSRYICKNYTVTVKML